jgi:hypothetical protein
MKMAKTRHEHPYFSPSVAKKFMRKQSSANMAARRARTAAKRVPLGLRKYILRGSRRRR